MATEPDATDATTATAEPEMDPDAVELANNPFVFGVASGDPDTASVVLWTRLDEIVVSEVDVPDGQIPVRWTFVGIGGGELGGVVTTDAAIGYSLHVTAPITEPGSYSFDVGGFRSPTGRAAPIDPNANEFRIAAGSCQNYQTGHYAAHRDIADWVPDLVVWLGDFIYEKPFVTGHWSGVV